jgi:hypothetical protein
MKITAVSEADPDPITFLAWLETISPGYKPTHHHGTSYVGMALTLEDLAQRLNRPAAELLAEVCSHEPSPS